jgi:hypothetical protein
VCVCVCAEEGGALNGGMVAAAEAATPSPQVIAGM